MKIAYLMHTYRPYDEIVETIKQLTKQGDHVFVMINDNDLRDKIYFTYAESTEVHISHIQEYAQSGDLSLARGTILQMKEASEIEDVHFDYYINLTDGMMPIKTRTEIIQYLDNHPANYYFVDHDDTNDHNLELHVNGLYVLTNLELFRTSKFVRAMTSGGAKLYYKLGLKKKNTDKKFIGSPYFILQHDAAKVLVEHYAYVSDTFKLSWYGEEMYIPMMLHKFYHMEHVNDDLRVLGPNGSWIASTCPSPITQDVINQKPSALFAAMITVENNISLYESYFDKYNEDYQMQENQTEKEREWIDPLLIKEALDRKNRNLKEK